MAPSKRPNDVVQHPRKRHRTKSHTEETEQGLLYMDEEKPKRSRGRPRLEPDDVTAADVCG
jgi:hypothetical protein